MFRVMVDVLQSHDMLDGYPEEYNGILYETWEEAVAARTKAKMEPDVGSAWIEEVEA